MKIKKRWVINAVAVILCVVMFSAIASFANYKMLKSHMGSIADRYLYTISMKDDSMEIKVIEDVPIQLVLRMDGKDRVWVYDGPETINMPDKAETTAMLYFGDRDSTRYSLLVSLHLKNTEDGWVISEDGSVLSRNRMLYGKNTDASMSEVSNTMKNLSDKICKNASSDYEKILSIHDWITTELKYDFDRKTGDTYGNVDAEKVISEKLGKCGGFSEVFRQLCHAQGIPCVNVYGATGNSYTKLEPLAKESVALQFPARHINHCWNECYVDGRWVIVDTTNDSASYLAQGKEQYSEPSHMYFDCSLEFFSMSHLIIMRDGNIIEEKEEIVATDIMVNEDAKDENAIVDFSAFSAWARDMVKKAIDLGLVPESLMSMGKKDITRAEFCKMAVQMLEVKMDKTAEELLVAHNLTKGSFSDTADADILAANALGIVSGYGNGIFNPDGGIKRQEAAAILARTAKVMEIDMTAFQPHVYADSNAIASWAKDAVSFCYEYNIMSGVGDNHFDPYAGYTREQSIVTMLRLFEL